MNLYSSVCLFALSGLFAIAPALAQRSLGNVTVQATPVAIAVDKTHNKIYVSNDNATPVLTVIDGATNVVSTIGTTPSGATAGAIAYSAFSDRIYRANVLSGGTTWGISRITFTPSLASLQISVPEAPQSIIIDESNGNAWVLGTSHAYLLLATGSSTTTTATVTVGNGPAAIAIADNDVGGDRRVYVANKTDGTVTRIATQNTATVYTVTVGANPQAIAVNQLTKKIYVANGGSGTVTVIDGPTAIGGSIGTSTVSVGTNPVSIAVNEATNKVYVVNAGDNSVTVLNGAAAGFGTTASVAATITNGNSGADFSAPTIVAVNSTTNRIYVVNSGNNKVTTINGNSNVAVNHPTGLTGAINPQALAVNPSTNRLYIPDSNGARVAALIGTDAPRDFDGDEKSDVFWKHTNGTTLVWQMNGAAIAGTGFPATVSDANWKVVGVGDFDGDGKSDLLWKHDLTGVVYVWLMNGTAIASTGSPATVGPASGGWNVRAVGDFDGDGKADILWQNTASGNLFVWLMNGTAISSTGSPATVTDAGWTVQGVGDFDGDGKADVLWQHANGTVYAWLMNGSAISTTGSPASLGAGSGWVVQGVGDFDGDGKADILWKNDTTGTVYVWKMNGTAISTTGSPATVGGLASGWTVQGVGDYDGDGKADVLWQNTISGNLYVWLMNGTAISATGSPATVDPASGWQVQNPK